jgi:Na+-transporting NADH:ubiquinone oxidoreductase subunit NqrC
MRLPRIYLHQIITLVLYVLGIAMIAHVILPSSLHWLRPIQILGTVLLFSVLLVTRISFFLASGR